MSNDRVLLIAAALSAGMDGWKWAGESLGMVKMIDRSRPDGGSVGPAWNPLSDNGDALDLAVRLHLSIKHNHPADQQRWVAVERSGCEGCYAPVSCVDDEFEDEAGRGPATRRAITRAAAEIWAQIEGMGQ